MIETMPIENVPCTFKILKEARLNLKSNRIIFEGKIVLTSNQEAKIIVPEIPLEPGIVYEIRLEIPGNQYLCYKEYLQIKKFLWTRLFRKSKFVTFYQYNGIFESPKQIYANHKRSHGIVKSLELVY